MPDFDFPIAGNLGIRHSKKRGTNGESVPRHWLGTAEDEKLED